MAIQERGADLCRALTLIDATLHALRRVRNEEHEAKDLMAKAKNLAAKVDTSIEKPRTVTKSVHRSNAGAANLDTDDYYRINVVLPALD